MSLLGENGDANESIPLDIRPEWVPLIRRLQSVAPVGGISILSVYVLLDENGNPLLWLPPKRHKIEPNKKAREILSELLARDGLGGV